MPGGDAPAIRAPLRIAALVEWGKGAVVAALAIAAAGWLDGPREAAVLAGVGGSRWLGGAAFRDALAALFADVDGIRGWALAGALVYVVLRIVEGAGLWRGRSWARWLGIGGCAIYLPFEAAALLRDPGMAPLLALLVTAALGALLWPPRRPENGAP